MDYASRTSKGARGYQEDAARVQAEPGSGDAPAPEQNGSGERLTVVLADGMGGHAGGALASNTVCDVFLRAYATAAGETPERLNEALLLANEAIAACVDSNPTLNGMGCTLVGVEFQPGRIDWVSVGDSPMFLVRRGEIFQLNEDHSLAPEIDKLAAAGKMSWEDAQSDPRRHFLRSALTGSEMEMVDRSRLKLEAGDIVVIASDGIHTLSRPEILGVVEANLTRGSAAMAGGLLAAVDAAADMYQDNTTVVVVTLPS